ncbi:murein hydrolase activator EnvC family protein [Vibrio campbellii]|uniref:Murein hydrolase activator EnvC n=1 Tax=Vibrio campbellii TaxID=680 RepID=A0AAQ3B135_9VIBR|nr:MULTISPECIES: murein hydrolase activator EnvC [Vibrio]MCC4226223.1 murein hydrolase activator EnvC [Vibrio campbellii]MCR9906746.1 murein hydrolase activator EnvC [Vibrio campbellii]PQJ39140.1 peptidase M23 [Vibrio campbellii]WDG08541.1 murein hydrolase activator EnvC [Vibrio campbellii]
MVGNSQVRKQNHPVLRSAILLTCALSATYPLTSSAASQQELKGVSSEINRQKKSLTSQEKQLNDLQKSLKNQELGISKLEREIKQTKTDLAQADQNINKLEEKIALQEAQRQAQEEELKQLLQTYYVTERAKANGHLLNEGVEEDRISQYFQHLAKARAKVIDAITQTTQELAHNKNQLELEKAQIEALLKQQSEKRSSLASTQSQRKGTLNKIQKSIKDDKRYLAELQRNETRLKAEIAKAAKRNAVPMDGIAKQRGKLPWPLKGRVLHNFGTKQTGQVNWKGMVLSANYGQQVKAVYPGTVVFAEYLRGYGLVVLLDHGKGDMTLYGYNQALTKKEGDKVTAGEVIALAGDTGGQDRASLYFEIRRNSEAQNPKSWLKRL